VNILFSPVIPDIRNSSASSASPIDNSVIKMKMNMERWWGGTDRETQKYSERNLAKCHFTPQNS